MNQRIISGVIGVVVGAFLYTKQYNYYGHGGAVSTAVPLVFVALGALYIVMGLKRRS